MVVRIVVYDIHFLQIVLPYPVQFLRNIGFVLAYDFADKFAWFRSILPIQIKPFSHFTSLFPCKSHLVETFEHLIEETFFPHCFLKVFQKQCFAHGWSFYDWSFFCLPIVLLLINLCRKNVCLVIQKFRIFIHCNGKCKSSVVFNN